MMKEMTRMIRKSGLPFSLCVEDGAVFMGIRPFNTKILLGHDNDKAAAALERIHHESLQAKSVDDLICWVETEYVSFCNF